MASDEAISFPEIQVGDITLTECMDPSQTIFVRDDPLILRIKGDGDCLQNCLAVALREDLRACRRNKSLRPSDQKLSKQEEQATLGQNELCCCH